MIIPSIIFGGKNDSSTVAKQAKNNWYANNQGYILVAYDLMIAPLVQIVLLHTCFFIICRFFIIIWPHNLHGSVGHYKMGNIEIKHQINRSWCTHPIFVIPLLLHHLYHKMSIKHRTPLKKKIHWLEVLIRIYLDICCIHFIWCCLWRWCWVNTFWNNA